MDTTGEPENNAAGDSLSSGGVDHQTKESIPNHGPLAGVRVIDFCSFIAGSYGAMVLGDFGAEVIKVEALIGDLARAWGPFFGRESRYFQGWNRNKRSIAIDLTKDEGRAIVYRLIKKADVMIENLRPGIAEKLKIDYATARGVNSRIIYCSSTAFGSRGPLRSRPAYDPVLQAMGGAAYGNLRVGGKVTISSVAVSDYQAAMLAASGILAALYHREKTGEGQRLETSLLQAVLSVQSHHYCHALEREEEGPVGICPYRLFETASDPIFVGAATDRFYRRLCDALNLPDMAADPRFATNQQRLQHQAEIYRRLEPCFRTKPAEEWEKLLLEKEVPCGIVATYKQFFAHPQVSAMDMNPVIDHPTIGPIRLVGQAVQFEKTPGNIRSAAPTLGQHSREILAEYGYDELAIVELIRSGVVGEAALEADRSAELPRK
jgi:crotonobetainyl-CoA:carnitine CoA-transferase CaiB-like acyl-CoA transferase